MNYHNDIQKVINDAQDPNVLKKALEALVVLHQKLDASDEKTFKEVFEPLTNLTNAYIQKQ